MHTFLTLVNNLRSDEQIYFRISEENYNNFYDDCQEAGIHCFFTGKQFRKEDVRGLMSITSDLTVGYVSGLCFAAIIAGRNTVDENETDIHIIPMDYDRLIQGEDSRISPDPSATLNGRQFTGKVISLQNYAETDRK